MVKHVSTIHGPYSRVVLDILLFTSSSSSTPVLPPRRRRSISYIPSYTSYTCSSSLCLHHGAPTPSNILLRPAIYPAPSLTHHHWTTTSRNTS